MMKKIIALASLAACPLFAQVNLIRNADFSDGFINVAGKGGAPTLQNFGNAQNFDKLPIESHGAVFILARTLVMNGVTKIHHAMVIADTIRGFDESAISGAFIYCNHS